MKRRVPLHRHALIALAPLAAACSSTPRDATTTDAIGESELAATASIAPFRFNEVARIGTHNSYWVDRDNVIEIEASGTEERIFDQLLFEHTRAIEIDVHKDDPNPKNWTVYHTDKQSNSLCSPLSECLKELRMFQWAQPKHEAVTVILELKELTEYNFDDTHTPADLDAILEANLGDAMFRPRDLMAHCKAAAAQASAGAPATLRECAAIPGAWPTVDEMRGKLVFTVIGNWRGTALDICSKIPLLPCSQDWKNTAFGHGPLGWVTYATWGNGVLDRSAFPMRSLWTHFNDGSEAAQPWRETVDGTQLQNAIRASVFAQAEATSNDDIVDDESKMAEDPQAFAASGGIVRIDNRPYLAGQTFASEQKKLQIVQTDAPWLRIHDDRTRQSVWPLDTTRIAGDSLNEPGERLVMAATKTNPGRSFAWEQVSPNGYNVWKTLPVTTRTVPDDDTHKSSGAPLANPRRYGGKGCLRATTNPHDPNADSFAVCRRLAYGAWNVSKPLDMDAILTVEVRKNGAESTSTYYSNNNTAGGPGDIIVMAQNANCMIASSASFINADGVPASSPLGDTAACFDAPLLYQGIAAEGGDVLFAGTEFGSGIVRANQLSGPERATTDTSVPADGGYSLIDTSWPAPSSACRTNNLGRCVAGVHRTVGSGQHIYATDIWTGTSWGWEAEAKDYFFAESSTSDGRAPFNRCWSDAQQRQYMRVGACDGADAAATLGFIATSPVAGTVPLFRARAQNDDLYTLSLDEAQHANGYAFDTIVGYVWPSANAPAGVGVTVVKTGDGAGTVNGTTAIVCGGNCAEMVSPGTMVTFTATPAAGSHFGAWSGGCTGSVPTCTVRVDQAMTVAASFYITRCTPKTCTSGQCGTVDDACGGTIQCGGCASGSQCSTNHTCIASGTKTACLDTCEERLQACTSDPDPAVHKTCVSSHTACVAACNCVPKTCASASQQCGALADGCGGTLQCGSCSAGNVCSAGQCVCVPTVTSCAGHCGRVANGCGGFLSCPSCSCAPSCSGKRCGAADGCGGTCYGTCAKVGFACEDVDGAKICTRAD